MERLTLGVDSVSLCSGLWAAVTQPAASSSPSLEHRVHLPHPEWPSSGGPRRIGSAPESPPQSGGTSGTCLDPCCRRCTDCPSCVGGTARMPTDFRIVHHSDGAATACFIRCQSRGTL